MKLEDHVKVLVLATTVLGVASKYLRQLEEMQEQGTADNEINNLSCA